MHWQNCAGVLFKPELCFLFSDTPFGENKTLGCWDVIVVIIVMKLAC